MISLSERSSQTLKELVRLIEPVPFLGQLGCKVA